MTRAAIEHSLPKMDASSAVYPTVRHVDNALIVAFHLPGCKSSAVLRFEAVTDWSYGDPNDEALAEHPFWGKGLRHYEFHKVQADEMGLTQYIATFHDGTLTVVANSVEVIQDRIQQKPWAAIDALFGDGKNIMLDVE